MFHTVLTNEPDGCLVTGYIGMADLGPNCMNVGLFDLFFKYVWLGEPKCADTLSLKIAKFIQYTVRLIFKYVLLGEQKCTENLSLKNCQIYPI